ncbi:MAG: hypothetical protein JW795_03935 [Chitinivibrionales bacterium]|nr:hypothetical protein [Chitinivibrionales bacterium]
MLTVLVIIVTVLLAALLIFALIPFYITYSYDPKKPVNHQFRCVIISAYFIDLQCTFGNPWGTELKIARFFTFIFPRPQPESPLPSASESHEIPADKQKESTPSETMSEAQRHQPLSHPLSAGEEPHVLFSGIEDQQSAEKAEYQQSELPAETESFTTSEPQFSDSGVSHREESDTRQTIRPQPDQPETKNRHCADTFPQEPVIEESVSEQERPTKPTLFSRFVAGPIQTAMNQLHDGLRRIAVLQPYIRFGLSHCSLVIKLGRWMLRLVSDCFHIVKIQRMSAHLQVGLADPAATAWAQAAALLIGTSMSEASDDAISLSIEPLFNTAVTAHPRTDISVKTSIGLLFWPLIRAVILFPYVSTIVVFVSAWYHFIRKRRKGSVNPTCQT